MKYTPQSKGNGYVNIGLGGKANYYRKQEGTIHDHFARFLNDLVADGKLDAGTAASFKAGGHPYYLYSGHGDVRKDNCFLIGDAAGLATVDLGEGIGPAIESALMTAGEITGTGTYAKDKVTQFSSGGLARRLAERFVAPKPVG